MNKKGFTLVELLAVIAILAILVIIALPNVLGRFNSAKSSVFVEEVQNIIKQAKTQFVQEAIKPANQGQTLIFASGTGLTLDLDGNAKNYQVIIDRNGNVQKVIVIDKNFCYYKSDTNIAITDVLVGDVKDLENDTVANVVTNNKCAGVTAQN